MKERGKEGQKREKKMKKNRKKDAGEGKTKLRP